MRMRRIAKKIKENPAFLSDAYIRSKVEAEHLWGAGFPSLNETLIRAEAKSTLPKEVWRQFRDQALDEQEQRSDNVKARWTTSFGKLLLTHKRVAVVGMILFLTFCYLTLFPSGRALAKSFFDYIMSIAGRDIEIESTEYIDNEYISTGTTEAFFEINTEYATVEEFKKETGITPFTIECDGLTCISVREHYSSYAGRNLWIDYQIGRDGEVSILQSWLYYDDSVSLSANSEYDNSFTLSNGAELYYAIDKIDGSFNGVILLEDSMLQISINDSAYFEEVLEALE